MTARRPRRVSAKVVASVEKLPADSPVRELFLRAFDAGWTIMTLSAASGLTHQALYSIITRPHGDCRGRSLRALQRALQESPPANQQ